MEYVEFLRVRKALVVFAIIWGGLMLFLTSMLPFSHVQGDAVQVGVTTGSTAGRGGIAALHDVIARQPLPLGLFFGIAGYVCTVIASSFSASLNGQRANLHFAFTKPISRRALAVRTMATDLGGVLVAYVYTFACCMLPIAVLGLLGNLTPGRHDAAIVLMGLGLSFMWFGILQAVTAGARWSGGVAIGVSWAVFGTLVGIGQIPVFGTAYTNLMQLLNVFNPFSYFFALVPDAHAVPNSILYGSSIALRIVGVWTIGIVAVVVAVYRWNRIEV